MTTTAIFLTAAASAGEEKKVKERGEIEQKYLWKVEAIFPDVAAWQAEYAAVEAQVGQLGELKGALAEGPAALLKYLKLRDEVEPRVVRIFVYANLLSDQDTRLNENQALESRARTLLVKYGETTAWFEPELTAIPFAKIEEWMKANKDLALYAQAFDNIYRQKKYILSPREEELFAMAGQILATPYTTYGVFANADMKFPSVRDESGDLVELSDAVFYKFVGSPDRAVRKAGYEGIVAAYAGFKNTAAGLLNGAVQSHVFNMKARGYGSCLEAALFPGNIPVQVYENLINTVDDSLPLLHRYTSLRKRALDLTDGVHDYDLYAPFVREKKLKYEYEDAVALIEKALAPLGPDYHKAMMTGFAERWVDVFPTRGKRSGAYSSGTFLTQPYILLNFFGDYDDVSTLAHEMGHSMHSFLSRGTQPYVYADYDIFCAEVASTLNEILLQDYVLQTVDDPQTRLYLLVEFLETFRGTIFRQTKFSEFEQKIHEMAEKGQPLTADALGQVYGELMKRYYGPDYAHDELVDSYWIRIPHFYYNFYVYKYATSYCAAANIARRIQEGQPGAVEAYLTFLKSGSSKYPIDLLKAAGVDMTSPEPIMDAMKHFEKLLDQTEELVEQMEKTQ